MEMRLLNMFCAVAESGSLVTAATKLHLTPSAISHSLKSLETELGCRLFERVGRRMVLNQAGDQLLLGIREPLMRLESVAESIKHLGHWGQSRLRIGASTAACQHMLPGVIRELTKTHPGLELQVESGDTPHVINLLRGTKVDLALCIAAESSPGLKTLPVFEDELMFVFAPTHSWAGGHPIKREDVCAQQFIGYQRTSLTARLIGDYFRQQQTELKVLMEVNSIGAIIEMVKLNLGISILAPWTIEDELVRGVLKTRPLGPKALKRRWSVVSLAVRPTTYVEEIFCRLCRNHATGMRLDRRDIPGVKD